MEEHVESMRKVAHLNAPETKKKHLHPGHIKPEYNDPTTWLLIISTWGKKMSSRNLHETSIIMLDVLQV